MSTNPTQTADTPVDHLRYEIAQLETMRQQILADMEALRQQENNLRAFESRLRESMPPMNAASRAPMSGAPATADAQALAAEWEKFQRSRALLEAERRALTDDLIALREDREALKRREEALKQREAWIDTREKDFAAKAFPPPQAARAEGPGIRLGFNEIPFVDLFRSLRRSA
jgi:chromosome segregation ATPase